MSLLYTELIKYKRSVVLWIALIGGFLSGTITILLVSSDNTKISWNALTSKGLNIINILALLLTAVITGYVFITEYYEHTISILFNYPISRIKLYIIKYFVILLFIIFLYLIFYFSTLIFGFISIGKLPQMNVAIKFINAILLASVFNFMIAPITALISIIIKDISAYIITGMSYCIVYMSFIKSDYSIFIPPCIPDKLVSNYFNSMYISKEDFGVIVIILIVIFLSAFIIGSFLYNKSDVYK